MIDIIILKASLLLFIALNITASITDIREYKISNRLVIALFALYPFYAFTHPTDAYVLWGIGLSFLFFLIGLGLFSLNIMGGGDVKMITAVALWVGPLGIIDFVTAMALVGAGMSLFMMINPLRSSAAAFCANRGWQTAEQKIMTDKLPYGVAIAAGGITAQLPLFISLF